VLGCAIPCQRHPWAQSPNSDKLQPATYAGGAHNSTCCRGHQTSLLARVAQVSTSLRKAATLSRAVVASWVDDVDACTARHTTSTTMTTSRSWITSSRSPDMSVVPRAKRCAKANGRGVRELRGNPCNLGKFLPLFN
jgi:hypothetical protein